MDTRCFGPFTLDGENTQQAENANQAEKKAPPLDLNHKEFIDQGRMGRDKDEGNNPFVVGLNVQTKKFYCYFYSLYHEHGEQGQEEIITQLQKKLDGASTTSETIFFEGKFDYYDFGGRQSCKLQFIRGNRTKETDTHTTALETHFNYIIEPERAIRDSKKTQELIRHILSTSKDSALKLESLLENKFSDLTGLKTELQKNLNNITDSELWYSLIDIISDLTKEKKVGPFTFNNVQQLENDAIIRGNALYAKAFMLRKMGIEGSEKEVKERAKSYRKCLDKAVKLGHAPAMFQKGQDLEKGEAGNDKDVESACPFYIDATKLGHPRAEQRSDSIIDGMSMYVCAYNLRKEGLNDETRKNHYNRFLDVGIQKGNASAIYQRGLDIENGFGGQEKDEKQGRAQYIPIAEEQCKNMLAALDAFQTAATALYPNDEEVKAHVNAFIDETKIAITMDKYHLTKPTTEQYKAFATSKLLELAPKRLNMSHNRGATLLRLLAKIILAVAAIPTVFLAWMGKHYSTGSATFLGAKSQRQVNLEQALNMALNKHVNKDKRLQANLNKPSQSK